MGTQFGRTLTETVCPSRSPETGDVSWFFCLVRSIIIIDDFLADEGVQRTDLEEVERQSIAAEQLRERMLQECGLVADGLAVGMEDLERWRRSSAEVDDVAFFADPASAVINKCGAIFYPIESLAENAECADELKAFVKRYFWILQILDDLADIQEDFALGDRQNLLSARLSPKVHAMLVERPHVLCSSVLRTCKMVIEYLRGASSSLGPTVTDSLRFGDEWLAARLPALADRPYILLLAGGNVDRWNWPEDADVEELLACDDAPVAKGILDTISAESFHGG